MDSEKAIASALTAEEVAESLEAIAATYARPTYEGVACVDGFGIKVAVRRGALVVSDGIGPHRRERIYGRATHGLRRLVVHNAEGYVTLEALRWCQAVEIGILLLGSDGIPVLASTPRVKEDARIRRQQALAGLEPVGLGITRYLLGAKLRGQGSARVADIEAAPDIEACRTLEAEAAQDYWSWWTAVPAFVAKDRQRVPRQWTRFAGRRSLIGGKANRADRPANAILNYLYALLEAEAVLACHVVSLDPGLGVVHADKPRRASMALDLMEPVRPEVDRYAREVIEGRQWRARDFHELPDGTCRLRAPLTHELAETMPMWARKLAPYAEKVAHMLGEAMAGQYVPSTPLTRTRVTASRRRRVSEGEELFRAEILPKLQSFPLRVICEETGMSRAQASRVKRGIHVPRPAHWPALRSLGGSHSASLRG